MVLIFNAHNCSPCCEWVAGCADSSAAKSTMILINLQRKDFSACVRPEFRRSKMTSLKHWSSGCPTSVSAVAGLHVPRHAAILVDAARLVLELDAGNYPIASDDFSFQAQRSLLRHSPDREILCDGGHTCHQPQGSTSRAGTSLRQDTFTSRNSRWQQIPPWLEPPGCPCTAQTAFLLRNLASKPTVRLLRLMSRWTCLPRSMALSKARARGGIS